jgi:hypothetical protein
LNSLLQPEERSPSCIESGSAVGKVDTAVCQQKVRTWLNVSADTIEVCGNTS